jgi:hypothetical protein
MAVQTQGAAGPAKWKSQAYFLGGKLSTFAGKERAAPPRAACAG